MQRILGAVRSQDRAVRKQSGCCQQKPELQGSLGVARRLVQKPSSLFRGGKMMIKTKAKEMYGDKKKLKDRFHQ